MRRLLHCTLLLALVACTHSAPEQQIREAIARIETAVEERDAGDVVAELAEHFDGNGHINRDQLRLLLIRQFLRHQNITVLLSNVDIELPDQPAPQQATMTATAIATGAAGLIPDDGRIWRLEGQWQLIDGDWLLTRLSWD